MKFLIQTLKAAPAISLLCVASLAQAQDGPFRLSAGVSTFGPTVEGAYRFSDNISLRGFGGAVDVSTDVELDGVSYDVNFDPWAVGALIDIHPLKNKSLRFSVGATYSEISGSGNTVASVANPVTVGSTVLTTGETVSANAEFSQNFAPMLSVGYDLQLGKSKWVLSSEAGAIFTGGYDVDIDVTGGLATLAPAEIQAEIDAIKNDLPDVNVYPFISVMIGMRF